MRRACAWRLGSEDRGAALLVAIGFVLMIGAITAGLSSLVTSSMNNRLTLEVVRDREYAADGAIEDAIVDVRARIDGGATTCSSAGGTSTSTINGAAIRVEWQPVCEALLGAEGIVVVQHDVAFAACPDTGSTCTAADVIISAQVNFEQDAAGVVAHTFVQSWSVQR
jgi:hypothetical protein